MLRSSCCNAIILRRATTASASASASAATTARRQILVLGSGIEAGGRVTSGSFGRQYHHVSSSPFSSSSSSSSLSGSIALAKRTALSLSPPSVTARRAAPSSAPARCFSAYVFDGFGSGGGGGGGGGSSSNWPVRRTNMVVNIVPQGHKYVVERFGKLHSIQDSGLFFAIPLIDNISYDIDVRERAMDIPPQSAITRDNVSVEVSGNLFVKFVNAEKAAYGAFNPLYSVTQHSQSAMRSAIGEMELDEILHGRARLNALIKGSLQEAAEPWGLEIRRYEITEITPDTQIRIAMDKQAAAERDRREQVLRAEGEKRTAELQSEGIKISLTNESEGNLIKVRNEAEASKAKILLEAQAQAEAIKMTAMAQAEALRHIADQLLKDGGADAARLALARDYVNMYGEMGKQSNTILFNDKPADVNGLLAQAVTAMKAVGASDQQPPVQATTTTTSTTSGTK